MNKEIQVELDKIEQEDGVRILFAIESGSRAWGFPSADSDYDVRFVYARPVDWYLSVFEGRDVIEKPISGLLDISGWDLKKAMQLLRKSNPALMEWIGSPINYRQHAVAEEFRTFAYDALLPLASCHHYRSMMKQHLKKTSSGEDVRLKRYLYTIRPYLAAKWVIKYGSQPPMLFQELVAEFVPAGEIRAIIDHLLTIKAAGVESDAIPRITALDEYLIAGAAEIEASLPEATKAHPTAMFNEKFRDLLHKIWS